MVAGAVGVGMPNGREREKAVPAYGLGVREGDRTLRVARRGVGSGETFGPSGGH